MVDCALLWMQDIIFAPTQKDIVHELYLCEYHKACQHTNKLVECYIINEENFEEKEDPRNINIQEFEGYRPVQGPKLNPTTPDYFKPIKIKQR